MCCIIKSFVQFEVHDVNPSVKTTSFLTTMSHDNPIAARFTWKNKEGHTQTEEFPEKYFTGRSGSVDSLFLYPRKESLALLHCSQVVRVKYFQESTKQILSEIESHGLVNKENSFGKYFVDRPPKDGSNERQLDDTFLYLKDLFVETQEANNGKIWNLGVCVNNNGYDSFKASFPIPRDVLPNSLLYLVAPPPTMAAPLIIRVHFETEEIDIMIEVFTGDGICIKGM
jgi:hypothetical protein